MRAGLREIDFAQTCFIAGCAVTHDRRPCFPFVGAGHTGLADRGDVVNFHAGTTSPRRAIWITVRTIARSISWRRSSRDSLLPLSMLSWQQTQIAAVAQSSAFRPMPLPSLRCATCVPMNRITRTARSFRQQRAIFATVDSHYAASRYEDAHRSGVGGRTDSMVFFMIAHLPRKTSAFTSFSLKPFE